MKQSTGIFPTPMIDASNVFITANDARTLFEHHLHQHLNGQTKKLKPYCPNCFTYIPMTEKVVQRDISKPVFHDIDSKFRFEISFFGTNKHHWSLRILNENFQVHNASAGNINDAILFAAMEEDTPQPNAFCWICKKGKINQRCSKCKRHFHKFCAEKRSEALPACKECSDGNHFE